MIKVSPEKNKNTADNIIKKYNLAQNSVILSAYNGGELMAYAAFFKNGHSAEVTVFEIIGCTDHSNQTHEQKFISELLLRAIGNYAANRNMVYITGENNNLFFTAISLGVNSSNDSVRIFIPALFKKCDSCEKE
ncbi:MAG: hypothetical protein K6F76_02525 [Clostridiales bacterium]|nr:hypothetical protein [Clostridiales bacterium]